MNYYSYLIVDNEYRIIKNGLWIRTAKDEVTAFNLIQDMQEFDAIRASI